MINTTNTNGASDVRITRLQLQLIETGIHLVKIALGSIEQNLDGTTVSEPESRGSGNSHAIKGDSRESEDGEPAGEGRVGGGEEANSGRHGLRKNISRRCIPNLPGSARTAVRVAIAKAPEPFTCDAIAAASGIDRKKVSVALAGLVTRFELKKGERMEGRQTYSRTNQFANPYTPAQEPDVT